MFVEEAFWLRGQLAQRRLQRGAAVLDIGSSTEKFRSEVQPHIDTYVFAPLRARGLEIVHLDAKSQSGVDFVCDVTDPDVDLVASLGRRFDVVLCCNLLEHVVDREHTVRNVTRSVAPRGLLVLTVPGRYRYHEDPIDTLYRPSPHELERLVRRVSGGRTLTRKSVPIRRRDYYRLRSPSLHERLRETVFWLVPPLHWRQTCVLFEVD